MMRAVLIGLGLVALAAVLEPGAGNPPRRRPAWIRPGVPVRLKLTAELRRGGVTGRGGSRLVAGKTGPGVIVAEGDELVAQFASGALPLNADSWDLVVEDKKTTRREVSPCDGADDDPSGPIYEAWRCGDMCRSWDQIANDLYIQSVRAAEGGDYSIRRSPGVIRRLMGREKRAAWKHERENCRPPDMTPAPTYRSVVYQVGCCRRWAVQDKHGHIAARNFRSLRAADEHAEHLNATGGVPF